MKAQITIPETWNEVKLSDYLEYYKRVKPYLSSEDEDILNNAAIDAALTQICKVDFDTLKSLDASSAIEIKTEVAKLLAQSTKVPLVKTFTLELDGETIEYGFEPNLDEMSYGCYLDLAEAGKDVWNNIWAFLATLYRPVTTKSRDRYRIAEYEGTDFSIIPYLKNSLTADIALGSVFFFMNLQRELLTDTLNYSRKTLMKKRGLLSRILGNHSQVSTEDLAASLHLLETTLQKSMALPDYQSTYASLLSSIKKNEAK
jgi:hypothetical protein